MKSQIIVAAFVVLAGAPLGWFLADTPDPVRRTAPTAPAITHAGAEAGDARARLRRLGFGVEPAPEEPPPPDVAILFRRDLTAVEQRDGRPVVWIVDTRQSFGRRALALGDVYQDGWRVARITAQSVELRRRRETRTISVFASPLATAP